MIKEFFSFISGWWKPISKDPFSNVSAWPPENQQEIFEDGLEELESQRSEIIEKLENSYITHEEMNNLLGELHEINLSIEAHLLLKRMS